jgi:hypothetical protein
LSASITSSGRDAYGNPIGAPRRLVRSAARRLGRRTSSVDYLVLLDAGAGPRWSVYFPGGRAFLADAHGRITQKIQ